MRALRRPRPKTDRSVRQLVAPLISDQRGRLVRMSVAAVFGGFAEAAVLVLIARLAFALASPSDNVTFSAGPLGSASISIEALIWATAALVIVRIALQTISAVLEARMTLQVVEQERRSLIRLYLAAGWPLQAQQREGRLQELVTTFTTNASVAVSSFASGTVGAFNLAALLTTALFVNPVASLAAAAAAVLIGALLRPLRAALRRRSGRSAAANLEFATGLTELTSTLQEVRIFNVEQPVAERIELANQRYLGLALKTGYVSAAIPIIYQGVAMLLMVGALGIAYAAGFTRLASLGAIALIMLRSLSYAMTVQSNIQALHQSAPFLEALDHERELYKSSAMMHGGEPVHQIQSIRFDDVSFAYEPDVPVLQGMTFEVVRGEVIGIVGPSGSGKSTLMQLLLRLREPTTGSMSIDGRPANSLALDDWYSLVSFVPQEAHLFAGSVADNIRFFRRDVDDAAIERSAKLAHIHEEISAWPQGYDTPVGERGRQLSGGQRQRLCIARALVEGPDLLILDEPTSSLDVRSEALVRETLAELAPHTTVFVIAHRLSTLAICDRIMVVLGGALEGFDTPDRLAQSNPFYAEALRLSGMK